VKKPKESQPRALVPARRGDSVDVFERVLTKGAMVEGVDATVDESRTGERAWLHVSLGGVDLLNVQTDLSWRSLAEPDEPTPAE
jgi:hypothetical protein